MTARCHPCPARRTVRACRGIALPFTLIALVVLLLAGVGLIRAMDVGLLQAGNLAFRRDLANQAERGIAQAVTLLNSGALATESAREAHSLANNYSATRLATNAQGIPTLLTSDAAFTAAAYTGADITEPMVCVPNETGTMPAATAAAEPDDEPPGVWAGLCGLVVTFGVKVANSVVTVLPSTRPSIPRSRATTAASLRGW